MSPAAQFVLGLVGSVTIVTLTVLLFKAIAVEVEDGEAVLVTRHGRLSERLLQPGLHILPGRIFPWVVLHRVSLRRDFRQFKNVHVNDAKGTTVIIDLWVEFRIEDPAKAVFAIAEWDRSLQNLVSHSATSILGNREFHEILCDREELARALKADVDAETERWGIDVERVFVQNVSLLPEVSRQIVNAIAARLERAKADIEERGRIRIAALEAETQIRVAELLAEAKGQYPAAIGRAYAAQKTDPAVLSAYRELYDLSLVRPSRTVTFRGFERGEIRAVDAAMLAPMTPGLGREPQSPLASQTK